MRMDVSDAFPLSANKAAAAAEFVVNLKWQN